VPQLRTLIEGVAVLAILLAGCSHGRPAANPAAASPSATTSPPASSSSSPSPSTSPSIAGHRTTVKRTVQGNRGSYSSAVSANGRYVAFSSDATNLVAHDTNRASDIFVRDTVARLTKRVSVSSRGAQANEDSFGPSLSADGRFVAFTSWASNLVPGDTNRCIAVADSFEGCGDVFIHDQRTGTTVRVSVSSSGAQGNERSGGGVISADGRHVAFSSWASTLVPGDTNECSEGTGADEPPGCPDVFVHDLASGTTERVSVAPNGSQFNSLSDSPSISGDGTVVAFLTAPDRERAKAVIYVRDRVADATAVVPDDPEISRSEGPQAPHLTRDGRTVFYVQAFNLPSRCGQALPCTDSAEQIFSYDRRTGSTSRHGPSSTSGGYPSDQILDLSISPDGRYAVFSSRAANLVPRDRNRRWDVFLSDMSKETIVPISVSSGGAQANRDCWAGAVSGDGRLVVFVSEASNLVSGDSNRASDIFLRDRVRGVTSRASIA